MKPTQRHLKSAHIIPLVILATLGMALLPGPALAQSCYGGFCGSGDGDGEGARIEVQVTISVTPSNGGSVTVNATPLNGGVFTALQGDTLELEAIPSEGYVFDRWSDWFDESTSSVQAPIYNHKTLTARFVEVSQQPAPVELDETESGAFPAGTVAVDPRGNSLSDISVELRQPRALPSNGVLIGDVYEFKPDGATFDPPIPISLPYDPLSLPAGIDENDLTIAVFDSTLQDWVLLPSEVNRHDRVVTTEVSHFSEYAVVAPLPVTSGNMPLLVTPGFSFSALAVTPVTPYQGQDVTVSVAASYIGANAQARSNVFVTLDGEVADETEIVLSPGDNVLVRLTVRPPQEGTYTVEVNGMTERLTVSGQAPSPALTQAIALAEEGFSPLDISTPSLLSQWRYAVYIGGGLVALLILGPLLRAFRRRVLRYRYDL